MSCLRIALFPKYSCKPHCGVGRLPSTLTARLDTTNLVDLYDFTVDDLSASWTPTAVTMSGGTVSLGANSCPNVGGDVSDPDAQFISFVAVVKDVAGNTRPWFIAPLPCAEDGTDSSISLEHGAVSFAQAPVNSVSMPTFVPRFSGGGGGATATCRQTIFRIGKITTAGKATLYSINGSGSLSSGPTVNINTVVTGTVK